MSWWPVGYDDSDIKLSSHTQRTNSGTTMYLDKQKSGMLEEHLDRIVFNGNEVDPTARSHRGVDPIFLYVDMTDIMRNPERQCGAFSG